jgi:hypothetical protein
MGSDGRPVSRDDLELAIWRITGTRDADKVDRILGLADSYAIGMTDRYVAGMEMAVTTHGYVGDGPYANSGKGGPVYAPEGIPPIISENNFENVQTTSSGADAGEDSSQAAVDRMILEIQDEMVTDKAVGVVLGGGIETKFCTGCRVEKYVGEFALDRTRSSGRRSKCKACVNRMSYIRKGKIAAE